jgi:hypothetical protein
MGINNYFFRGALIKYQGEARRGMSRSDLETLLVFNAQHTNRGMALSRSGKKDNGLNLHGHPDNMSTGSSVERWRSVKIRPPHQHEHAARFTMSGFNWLASTSVIHSSIRPFYCLGSI